MQQQVTRRFARQTLVLLTLLNFFNYVDRQGARLDKVAGTRYFCTQCHVPQADTKPLVGNTFENATQVK